MAFDPRNPNLGVWLREEPTDPAYTKPITGKAFKGTALSGGYVAKRLTAAFGPLGLGWGYTAEFDDTHMPSGMSVNWCKLSFWYYPNGCTGEPGSDTNPLRPIGERSATITQVGGTQLAGTFSSGKEYLDDEARKKSLTDALLKIASHIGIGGDIHLGMFDDSKYVAERKAEEAQASTQLAAATIAAEVAELVDAFVAAQNAETYTELATSVRSLWPSLTLKAHQQALTDAAGDARKRLGIPDPAPKATATGRAAA
jgi:hypothetical protein